MAHDHSDDAIHPASEIKLARAKQQGEVCRSDVLAQAVQVGVGLLALGLAAVPLSTALLDWTRDYWMQGSGLSGGGALAHSFAPRELLSRLGWPLGLFLAALFVLSCGSHLLQTGWTWGQRPLWSGRSLRPAANLQQSLAPQRWLAGLAGLIGFGLLVGWWLADSRGALDRLSTLWSVPAENLMPSASRELGAWMLPLVGGLLILGGLDYAVQRWLYYRRLQMSEQELRDEQKEEQNLARTALRKGRRSF